MKMRIVNHNFFSFPIIFIGDTHGYLDDFKIQRTIIKKAKPSYVLYETLEERKLTKPKDFNLLLQEKKISEMTKLEDAKKLVMFCQKRKIPLIGIDYKNFGVRWAKKFQQKLNSKTKFTKKEKTRLRLIRKKRENKQLKMIKQYAPKGRVVVITGAYHLRKKSPLILNLKNFATVLPCYKGKPVFSPLRNKNRIRYELWKKT